MMDTSPLRVAAMVANSEWALQLSAHKWVVDEDVVIHVGRATSDEAIWDFNSIQTDALRQHIHSDARTAIAAVSKVLPTRLHLFVSSGNRRLALWQHEPGGPLTLLQFLTPQEMQSFPDHRVSCPLGHTMPSENNGDTLSDHFIVSPPDLFDAGAGRYETQLDEFFSLPNEAARSAWLDSSYRGTPGESDAERLDPVFVSGGEFLRCTERCGYYKWFGSWLRDNAMS